MKRWYDLASAHRFFDPWEEKSNSERYDLTKQRLIEYITLARKLPFYQKRLAGFDSNSDHPLKNVHPLLPDELKGALPPFSREMVGENTDSFNIFQSGGTTGFPKTALFKREEMERLDFANARGYYATGLLPTDRVGNLFAVGSLYMTFLHIHTLLQNYGCSNFAFSHVAAPDFFKLVAEKFQINVLAGVSSVILNMLRQLDNTTLKIERIYYGGEHMYESDKKMLAEKFGTKAILSPGYGTVDTWYIGYQCTQTPTGVFHTYDDQCFTEIVDEETGAACAAGEVGMVYATPFERKLTPIVRYRVGDLAKWVGTPCGCGRTTPLFELLGRGDDRFRIGFDTVDYDQLHLTLAKLGPKIGPFQMERRRHDNKDELVLRIETHLPSTDYQQLKIEIERQVLASRPVMEKNISEGTAWPMVIELLPMRALPLNPRTGKLKRVIDIKS